MNFEDKVSEFLDDRKYMNNIVESINYLKLENSNLKSCILALERLYITILKRNDFYLDPDLSLTDPSVFEIEKQFVEYLKDLLGKTWDKLILLLAVGSVDTREQVMVSAMNLWAAEVRYPTGAATGAFPQARLKRIILVLLSSEADQKELIELFKPFLSYKDVYYSTWKVLKDILVAGDNYSDLFISNTLALLENMAPPKKASDEPPALLCYDEPSKFVLNEDILSKCIQRVWRIVTNQKLSLVNHRRLFIALLEGYLSSLRKPTLLTDFFMGSLGIRGAVSLLALQAMSTLVMKHNLECPNIFGKLYNMFDPHILHTKYKSRLFFLADLFLQSTYVQEQLVAAFAKRMSRLSLVSQAPDLVLILHFVGNLLIRHPALTVMIHHPVGGEVEEDPYDADELDPLKSRALESSLWELALLKKHVQPKVANAAKFLDSTLPTVEWDLREDLDASYSDVFEKEMKRNIKAPPSLTFIRPAKIAKLKDDRVYKLWALT